MNKEQLQIIYGSLLGGAYISSPKTAVNRFLTIPSIKGDLDWLKYKAFKIQRARGLLVQDRERWVWRSTCNPFWNEMYDKFYDLNGKMVKMEIMDSLCDDALAVWFLDKGFFASKNRICLRTTRFGYEGNLIMRQFFNEVGIPCEIRKERNTGRILFTEAGTRIFIDTIRRVVPEFMAYRLLSTPNPKLSNVS